MKKMKHKLKKTKQARHARRISMSGVVRPYAVSVNYWQFYLLNIVSINCI